MSDYILKSIMMGIIITYQGKLIKNYKYVLIMLRIILTRKELSLLCHIYNQLIWQYVSFS